MTMFSTLTGWDNLLLAYRKAARGKRGKPNVAAFEHRLEDNLCQLQDELRRDSQLLILLDRRFSMPLRSLDFPA